MAGLPLRSGHVPLLQHTTEKRYANILHLVRIRQLQYIRATLHKLMIGAIEGSLEPDPAQALDEYTSADRL